MLKIKNSTSVTLKKMLKRCQDICDIKLIKQKISDNKLKSTALALAVIFLTAITVFAANYRVGYTVKVENVVLGTVATKGEYYEILDEVKTEVSNISELEFEPVEEEFSVGIVSVDSFSEKEEIAENVKAISEGMVPAHTITADGDFVVALNDFNDAVKLKDTYLENFKEENENITVSYGADVNIAESHVPEDAVLTYEEAEAELLAGKYIIYTVAENDTPEQIAENYDTTVEEIMNANEIEEILLGQNLKIYTGEPAIPIKTVEYINGNVDVPFEVIQKEDSTVYRGQTRIETYGVNGEKYLHAYVTRINGYITEENVIESVIFTEPVAQVELVGTKDLPSSTGTGKFIMPTSGSLTSAFGRRWGRSHTGIDVAAKSGTPIYASDNGIVIESEYRSNGYGNIVKIDHQNGYVSYYAHCSKLYANVGDVVAKGDLIAAVGNTGRSTGPHLHFEIRHNDVPQNPYNFIK